MRVCRILVALVLLIFAPSKAEPADAAGRVRLELVGDAHGPAFQQWLQTLSRAGVKNVRFRSAQATDKVGIEVQGTPENRLYVVTGIVKSSDELLLPGGGGYGVRTYPPTARRFRARDAARLAAWLDDLAKYGPEDQREPKAAFGLSRKQFQQIQKELARPVGFSTRGIPRREVVEKIGGRLSLPLTIDPKLATMLEEDKVGEELSGLSCGTALAYVLRPMGLCLVPRASGDSTVCAVVKAEPKLEVWPVGWEPEKPQPEVLPELYKFHDVNIQGVSAATALEEIGKRLEVPVLIDHNALARHGIDPKKANVSLPSTRTTYSLTLRKILFQARLKSELRVDEAGKPFLWVSTIKPV
jgi:hypothetical protein